MIKNVFRRNLDKMKTIAAFAQPRAAMIPAINYACLRVTENSTLNRLELYC